MSRDFSWMQLALEEAQQAALQGEVPVGCVIVFQNTLIARAFNTPIALKDPTAHAEILALRQAGKRVNSHRLDDCDLYVTLEPCAMCAQAIAHARIRRVYFAAYDPKGGAIDHGPRLYQQPTCHHRPEVYGGLLEDQSATLLKAFFHAKR